MFYKFTFVCDINSEIYPFSFYSLDIEKTLSALDTVINYYTVSQEVDSIIRSGPSHTADGLTQLDPFLKAMEKLQTAQEYFEKHNPQSVELENVSTLYNSGGNALNREFKELLQKHSKPVLPVLLMDLISVDEGAHSFYFLFTFFK